MNIDNLNNKNTEECKKYHAGQSGGDFPKKTRFIVTLLLLVGAIIFVVSWSMLAVSRLFSKHVSCQIAERSVDTAWIHAQTITAELRDTAKKANSRVSAVITQNPGLIRRQLNILIEEDPTILYGGVVTTNGAIIIHTDKTLEGLLLKKQGFTSVISPRVRELPQGRQHFNEHVYEVNVPVDPNTDNKYDLFIGISKMSIDAHVADVDRDVKTRIVFTVGAEILILLIPAIALWWVLRRHTALSRKAQSIAHMAQIGQLASGLAHEIRNPLNAVRFNLKILEESAEHLDQDVSCAYSEIVRRASEEITRVDGLLSEYLDFTKPQRNEMKLYDVNNIIRETVRFVDHECLRHKITLVLDLTDSLPKIFMDRHRIKQAILNLLLNSQKELRETGGTITIRSIIRDGHILISVIDNGSGISRENQQRVFEPFWTSREDGVGLGLAITKQIIEEHKGDIVCEDASNGGAMFTISLTQTRDVKHNEGT